MADLWQYDEPIRSYAERVDSEAFDPSVSVPRWIDQDITPADVAAILQGGCDSGAYMPAVTYHDALATMNEHGDAILDYLDEAPGDTTIPEDLSWAGLACWYVSRAVEQWAANVESELSDLLDGI